MRCVTDHSDDILCKIDLAHSPTEEGGRKNEEHELYFELNDTKADASDPDIDSDLVTQHFGLVPRELVAIRAFFLL
eukprot:13807960-Ditylum_brightwellii.AAC.1